jgi:hypothetical protein
MVRQVLWRPLSASKLARYSRLRWRSRSRGNTEMVLDCDCAKNGRASDAVRFAALNARARPDPERLFSATTRRCCLS